MYAYILSFTFTHLITSQQEGRYYIYIYIYIFVLVVFHPRRAPIRNPAENPPAPGT
jgi:hypothetical protein